MYINDMQKHAIVDLISNYFEIVAKDCKFNQYMEELISLFPSLAATARLSFNEKFNGNWDLNNSPKKSSEKPDAKGFMKSKNKIVDVYYDKVEDCKSTEDGSENCITTKIAIVEDDDGHETIFYPDENITGLFTAENGDQLILECSPNYKFDDEPAEKIQNLIDAQEEVKKSTTKLLKKLSKKQLIEIISNMNADNYYLTFDLNTNNLTASEFMDDFKIRLREIIFDEDC